MNVAFITSRYPYPYDKGDKLRVFYQLKSLSKHVNLHLIALTSSQIDDAYIEALQPYCKTINTFKLSLLDRVTSMVLGIFKGIPFQVSYFFNNSVKRKINSLISDLNPEHIHCHLIRTTEYVRHVKHIPKSLDFMDAYGMGMKKRETTTTNLFFKWIYRWEKNLLYNYESSMLASFDTCYAISEQDTQAIPNSMKKQIEIVANGVDFEKFYPKDSEKKYDVVFMGNMDYPPNIYAIRFFVTEVMGLLKQSYPEIKLLIAGKGATSEIKNYADDNIDVIEHFDDISDSIAWSKIMIAPMFISIGLQNKIIQSMAMKVPVVLTPSANKAIKARNGVEVIEANTPEEFSKEILQLLQQESRIRNIAESGYEFVKKNFDWDCQNQKLIKLFGKR